jgi:hypothetical protein
VVVVIVGGVILAGIIVRYEEPNIASRLVHRYGVALPLIVCGVVFVLMILLARKIEKD